MNKESSFQQKQYSIEEKQSICFEYETSKNLKIEDVCNKYEIGRSTFTYWLKRYRKGILGKRKPQQKKPVQAVAKALVPSKSPLEEENSLLRSIVLELTMKLALLKRGAS